MWLRDFEDPHDIKQRLNLKGYDIYLYSTSGKSVTIMDNANGQICEHTYIYI